MPTTYWSQDSFSQGELSPLMYSRIGVKKYYDALKTAKNVFTLPQGAATKRFGTKYITQVIDETDYENIYFKSWQYLDECTYVLVIRPTSIDFYLEGDLQESLPTVLEGDEIKLIDHTVLDNRFRIATGLRNPFDIVRQGINIKNISGHGADYFETSSSTLQVGLIFPVILTGNLAPSGSPSMTLVTTYYSRALSTNTFALYANLSDATNDVSRYTIASLNTAITGFTGGATNTLTIGSTSLVVGRVSYGEFESGTPPTTTPPITLGETYYTRNATTSTFHVYATEEDAQRDENRFTISSAGTSTNIWFRDLTASFQQTAVLSSADTVNNLYTIDTGMLVTDSISPVRFSNGAPPTSPQIRNAKTYFSRAFSSITMAVYETAQDAEADVNRFSLEALTSATNTVSFFNKFTLTDVSFKNKPTFDFGDYNYDTATFTPDKKTGTDVVLTMVPGSLINGNELQSFTSDYIGGSFRGNGGLGRIVGFTSLSLELLMEIPFTDILTIPGTDCLLSEPAWSDTRGFPSKVSSFQSRAIFANTDLLPNGIWLSFINDYNDFNDLETTDDAAISWYPTSDSVNVIKFIVPYRSLTVHTNSGVFSTPLAQDTAITPKNFSLLLQDSTPATKVSPRAIDNQIIVLSGDDAHSLIFDGINNAYTTRMISIVNEQVLNDPIDEAEFRDFSQAGSRYMFVINSDGTLAIYQTLLNEEISGWTTAVLEQSYGEAKFRALSGNYDGRLWFMNERQIAEASAPIALSGSTSDTLTAVANGFDNQSVTAFKFITVGIVTTPQVTTGVYYWAVSANGSADIFYLYESQEDALADINRITITSYTGGIVEPWPLSTTLEIEEIKTDGVVDGAGIYEGVATSTLTNTSRFNAQTVKINGDGFGFEAEGINDEIQITAHGQAVEVEEAEYGYPIDLIIEPLPLSIAMGQQIQTTNLAKPKHIKLASFMMNDTVGGTVNNIPIAVNKFNQANIGSPPTPMQGFFEFSVMKGWDDFNNPTFTIRHNEPFNFRLLGIYYTLEV